VDQGSNEEEVQDQYCIRIAKAILLLTFTDLPPSFPIFDVSGRETSVIPQFSQYFAVLGM
jgi:hypothetical protein